jgi:UDP-N-acetylglucosamine:LPS N-acetylglucosamine transferase
VRAYVHNVCRHLAACDLVVVQGGLTTAMELTANRRPFLSFPLRHFEPHFDVRHRLQKYGAGRVMDYETDGPTQIAQAIDEKNGPHRRLPSGRLQRCCPRRIGNRSAALIQRRPYSLRLALTNVGCRPQR